MPGPGDTLFNCDPPKMETDHDFGYEIMKRFFGVVTLRLEATRSRLVEVYAAHG